MANLDIELKLRQDQMDLWISQMGVSGVLAMVRNTVSRIYNNDYYSTGTLLSALDGAISYSLDKNLTKKI